MLINVSKFWSSLFTFFSNVQPKILFCNGFLGINLVRPHEVSNTTRVSFNYYHSNLFLFDFDSSYTRLIKTRESDIHVYGYMKGISDIFFFVHFIFVQSFFLCMIHIYLFVQPHESFLPSCCLTKWTTRKPSGYLVHNHKI